MESLILISTILFIHITAWFTPGPLFVLIVRNSLVYSRKAGIWTAVGIAGGNFVHITYSVLGILFLISTSNTLFTVIKFLGVGYLTYLGIKTLVIKGEALVTDGSKHKDISACKAMKTGFLTNLLSPKASLFFASIFAAVLSSSAPFWVVVVLWATMPFNSFIMASLLSAFFTQKRVRFVYAKYQVFFNRLLGLALLLFAVMIAFQK